MQSNMIHASSHEGFLEPVVNTMLKLHTLGMCLLPDTPNWGLRMRRECQECFRRHRLNKWSRHTSRHVRHARTVMYVGIANPRWRVKHSRHSRRMCNPQFYVSGKKPMYMKMIKFKLERQKWNGRGSITTQSGDVLYIFFWKIHCEVDAIATVKVGWSE